MAPTASTSALQQQPLHLASARRATFNKTRKGANKALNWPYPLTAAAARTSTIHPDRLVEAGFYCTPTLDDPTVTTCFLCEIVIGQWEEGEDPLYRHEAAIDEAEIRCGWLDVLNQSWTKEGADGLALTPRETWPEIWGDEMHPRGERMTWARLATFRLGWPHEGQDGVPTKEEIAAAGWVFRPAAEEESQDQCACIYCGRTVEGWEEGDDPVALHKRKIGLKCPFFLADDSASASSTSASAKAVVNNPNEAVEDATEADEPEPEPEIVKPKRGSRKTVVVAADEDAPKKKKSTRGTAAAQKKKAEADQEEVDPAEEEADVEEQEAASRAVDEGDASEAESLKPTTAAKGTKKGKAGLSTSTATKKKTARQTTSRSTRAKTTPAVSEAEDAPPDQQADVSVLRKSTRARAASNASTTSTAVPILRTTAAAALNKSTRSRNTTAQAAPPPPSTAESFAEVDAVATKRMTTVESSDLEPVVKPPKRSASRKATTAAVIESSTSAAGGEAETNDANADGDESIAQLARIADAALEAQGPEEERATMNEPVPPPVPSKDNKKSKKVSPSASASSSSSGSTNRAKKGKKAAVTEPAASPAGAEESSSGGRSGAATPRDDKHDAMVVEGVGSAKAKATAADAATPASRPTSTSISQTAPAPAPAPISTLPPAPPLPPTSARSPLSPTSPGTSSSRPIRALPPNKSSKSPSSSSLGNNLSLPGGMEAVPPVPPAPAVTAPAALPSQSSSQSSLPTSAFETASERLSSAILLDPNAPFTAPTNPFAGSTLLSLVPPPTQQELETLTVAEWYSLCHRRIADRFTAESEAMQKQFEARVEAGRTKLRGMCEEAREREEREAREEEENRRAVAKERKDRIAASGGGGGSRSAVKAAGGSTRKLR